MEIIKNISQTLELDEKLVAEKFGINENSTNKDLAQKLGIYALFESKEKISEYIKNKVSNKELQIQNLNSQLEKYLEIENNLSEIQKQHELSNLENQSLKTNLKKLINSEWEKTGIKNSLDLNSFDLKNLDFGNIKKSLLKYADEKGFSIPNNETKQNSNLNKQSKNVSIIGDFVWRKK